MKKIKTTAFFLGLILAGSGLSCSTFSSGDSSNASANSSVNCPTTTLTVIELTGAYGNTDEQIKKYPGCTVSVKGVLEKVKSEAVTLRDTAAYAETIECKGDFSSDTYRKIGYKLDNFKEESPGAKLPVATFTAKIVASSGIGFELEDCRMTDYGN